MFECRPVSTKVMRQSSMSLPCSSTVFGRPRDSVKSLDIALVVVQEVLADHVAAVAEAQDEVLVAEVRVVAHQVPEDRPVADVHQRLRDGVRVLAQPRAEAAAEQHDLHVRTPPRDRCLRSARRRSGAQHAPAVDDERRAAGGLQQLREVAELVPARDQHHDLGVRDGLFKRCGEPRRRAASGCVVGRATGS